MQPSYLELLSWEKFFHVGHRRVMRENTDLPSIRRHNEDVVWTIAAALEVKDLSEELMEAQADLQTVLGMIRLERENYDLSPELERALDEVEDQAAKALARLHVILESLGTTMFCPAQHPDITG